MRDESHASCYHCGTGVVAPPFALREGRCQCEACFLKERELRFAADAREADQRAFAEALAGALDARERETGLHSKRVACHTLVLANRFYSDPAKLRQIYWGALLHDIGKIGIPDSILLKKAALEPDEQAVMRTHCRIGHGILKDLPFMSEAAELVLAHEERFDGSGYPHGLAGDRIPLGARLFAIIDTLDAMTSDRPYRAAGPFDMAKAEIVRMGGTQFDPNAVDAFLAEETVLREMVAMKCGAALVP